MGAADRLREHAAAYPVFAAPPEAIGCGRVVGGKPTPEQRLYIDAVDTYLRERLEPWRARKVELEAEAEAEKREGMLW